MYSAYEYESEVKVLVAQSWLTLCDPHGLQPARLLCPWNFLGKDTKVGSHSLLHGIFLNQGMNLGLPRCRQILYLQNHQGSPLSIWARHPRMWSQVGLRKEASLRTKLMEVMEFQLSYFKFWKMMPWQCCTQYASKFGKLSSGHNIGKGQFSFQFQRKTMPKNAHTTA